MQTLHVLVPVFNEAPNIPALLEAFRALAGELSDRYRLKFILVDDGSTDDTAGAARKEGAGLDLSVLAHGANKGPGAAFATGFTHLAAAMGPDDWVITMEGDNTSRHELIRQMLTRAAEGFDAVFASPYMYGGGIVQTSLLRKILSGGANLIVKDVLEIQGILTVSSFFRLYRAATLRRMQAVYGAGIVERVGFESMVEMCMKMTMMGISISEIAMVLDTSRRKGKSKMKLMRTILGYLELWRYKRGWKSMIERATGTRSSGS